MDINQFPILGAPVTGTFQHDYQTCGLFRGGKCTCDLASNVQTKIYPDGTKAIGAPPLPEISPASGNDSYRKELIDFLVRAANDSRELGNTTWADAFEGAAVLLEEDEKKVKNLLIKKPANHTASGLKPSR